MLESEQGDQLYLDRLYHYRVENEPYDSNILFNFVGVIIYIRYMSEYLIYFYN